VKRMLPTANAGSAPSGNKTGSENGASPSATLLHMATGAWLAQAIYVAAKLGVADLLVAGPRSAVELAAITGAHAGALYRILRALASVTVFAEDEVGRFHLTPTAECLCTEAPGSLRAFIIMLGEQEHWRAWGEVIYSVRTGRPAFDLVFGMPRFQYFANNPGDALIFSEAMTSRSNQENEAIIAAYDFSEVTSIVDVGGGQGSLLAAILRTASEARCVLFDLPDVIALARNAARTDEALRHAFVEGDFFNAIPVGADAYVLKKVIQDWDDEHAVKILMNCRAAMPRTGRLLLIEPIIPGGNSSSFNKLLDLLLLIWTPGGKARTELEHRALLAASDLKLARLIPTGSWLSLIEALPAD